MAEIIQFPDPYAADRETAAEIFNTLEVEEVIRLGFDPGDPAVQSQFEALFLYLKYHDRPSYAEGQRLFRHTPTADGGIWFDLNPQSSGLELVPVDDPEVLKLLA